uniref:Uncharacterized protein n=1 Tax=viral metagenome TaxID=1070528 RepID=A0A6C0HW33_9ZZZZ
MTAASSYFHFFFNSFVYILFFNYIYRQAEEGSKVKIVMNTIIQKSTDLSIIIKPFAESFVEASEKYHKAIYGLDIDNEDDEDDEDDEESAPAPAKEPTPVPKPEIKYEDKYLNEFHNLEMVKLSKEKLDSLKNSIIMESTPLGNALMFYDNTRETFTFYSDNTIPYRFLETIARKYVITTNSKEIYVDMSKEIEDAKNKIKEKQDQLNQPIPLPEQNKKKDVFAKLKSYNKDTDSKTSASSRPNQPLPQQPTATANQENMVLKERANRYSYEGKIVNFSFLKKVDKKLTDKRYAMTFADFKKSLTQSSNQSSNQ